jgi:hypothetical protein
MTDERKLHTLHYVFTFNDGVQKDFTVNLDAETLRLVTTPREDAYPAWTEMESFQCAHCPLDKAEYKHCPVAVNVIDLIDYFREFISHTDVHIAIETPERSFAKHSTAQSGVSSLLGIYMVTSGCPIMEQLKPMVRHHLPFATLEETKYRAMSMYLLAQYFRHKAGLSADLELKGLIQIYEDIHTINVNFADKLTALKIKDTSLNAISILDSFADFTSFSIDYEMQDEMLDFV